MFCPRCSDEFVEGVDRCPDCEVALVERLPERSPEPVFSGTTVAIVRSGKLFEADLAASLLEDAGVPHFRQEQSSSGLTFAMPAAPSVEPGTWWVIRVPEEAAARAREVLEQHPLELDGQPGVWDFAPTPEAKSFFKGWASLWLLLLVAVMISGLVSVLLTFF